MTSGRSPFTFGQAYSSMQKRLCARCPTHFAGGLKSSQTTFLFDSSYQLFRHCWSTSVQYSPSTSFISEEQASGEATAFGAPAGPVCCVLAAGATFADGEATGD